MFVVLAGAVFAGEVTAPLVALLVVLAPLLVLLAGGRGDERPEPSAVTAVAGLLTVGTVLSANVMVMTGVASLCGIPPRQSLVLTALSACLTLVWRRAPVVWSFALVLGMAGLTVIVVAMGMALPAAPWTAWTHLASRPALAFSPGTAWVTEGRTLPRPTTLTFDETHHVTAVNPGVFRVEEREQSGVTVREWRLNPGDALALRAGDRLTVPPDARVRFEAGKRIPGAATSGVAWAEPPRRASWPALVEALGLAVTLAGGAATVMGGHARATRLTAVATPVLLIAFALVASSWGVYAVWFAADLGLGAPSLGPLVEAPQLSLGGDEHPDLLPIGAFGLVMLFIATTAGLKCRVGNLTAGWRAGEGRPAIHILPDVLWLGMLAVGAGLSQWELEPGTLLPLGLGLGASAWAAPRLVGNRRGVRAGTVMGAAVFAALSIAHALALPAMASLGPYPALVAAPVAAVVAAVGRRRPPLPRAHPARPQPASVAGNGGR